MVYKIYTYLRDYFSSPFRNRVISYIILEVVNVEGILLGLFSCKLVNYGNISSVSLSWKDIPTLNIFQKTNYRCRYCVEKTTKENVILKVIWNVTTPWLFSFHLWTISDEKYMILTVFIVTHYCFAVSINYKVSKQSSYYQDKVF